MHHMKQNYWEGKTISPIPISENMTITQLVDEVFDGMGYIAKGLAEACHLFKTMIDDNSTFCLSSEVISCFWVTVTLHVGDAKAIG